MLTPVCVQATTYTVNSPADVPDVNPGNNICETMSGNFVCTLRAAIQESNAHAGPDTIELQSGATYVLTRVGDDNTALSGDLDIFDNVAILAPAGGANAIIDGNSAVAFDHVLHLFKCLGNIQEGGACTNGAVGVVISGVTIQHGRSNFGGGILNDAILTLSNCTVMDNRVDALNSLGGGIFNGGSLTIDNCTIANNSTGAGNPFGGGIYNQGPLTITNSTIRGNTTPGSGGGLYAGGATTIRTSTVSGNTANLGGGIYKTAPPLNVINSTISGNFSNGSGGGIYSNSGPTSLFNTTVASNLANADNSGSATGGGAFNAGGSTFTFANSIISANETILSTQPFPTLLLDDCSGILTSQGNNIVSDVDSFHCTVNGAYAASDANLGPLQNNGGPTFTHALLNPSVAIDAGNSGGCVDDVGAILTNDQRGAPRPQGVRCDIGAFEASDRLFGDGFES